MYQNIGSQRCFFAVCKQNASLNYELNYIEYWFEMYAGSIGMRGRGKRWKNSTSIHTALFHQDAAESFGSWPWRRARRTSCHWGSKCQAPTADRPHGCPASGSKGSPSKRDACLAMPAGNTWSGCSPVNDRERQTGQIQQIKKKRCSGALVTQSARLSHL